MSGSGRACKARKTRPAKTAKDASGRPGSHLRSLASTNSTTSAGRPFSDVRMRAVQSCSWSSLNTEARPGGLNRMVRSRNYARRRYWYDTTRRIKPAQAGASQPNPSPRPTGGVGRPFHQKSFLSHGLGRVAPGRWRGSELVAQIYTHRVQLHILVAVGEIAGRVKMLRAEIIVAILGADDELVGQRVVDAGTHCPADTRA